jgi:hypothetical protein
MLARDKTLAYYKNSYITDKKCFITMGPEHDITLPRVVEKTPLEFCASQAFCKLKLKYQTIYIKTQI